MLKIINEKSENQIINAFLDEDGNAKPNEVDKSTFYYIKAMVFKRGCAEHERFVRCLWLRDKFKCSKKYSLQ